MSDEINTNEVASDAQRVEAQVEPVQVEPAPIEPEPVLDSAQEVQALKPEMAQIGGNELSAVESGQSEPEI